MEPTPEILEKLSALEIFSDFSENNTLLFSPITEKECPTLSNKTRTPHSFRHSKAVHFLQNGTALPIIQRFLGHSSIQTTEIYLDITNDVVIEAVNLSANLIDNEPKEAVWTGDDKLIQMLESLK